MEVFSTVVVEISETVYALLPPAETYLRENNHGAGSADSSTQDSVGPEVLRATFLKEKSKQLNVNVTVVCDRLTGAASLSIRGGWNDICALRTWLIQFVQTSQNMQSVRDTVCEPVVADQYAEVMDGPRRSPRNRHREKHDHRSKGVSSHRASLRQTKTRHMEENTVQTKKSKAHVADALDSKTEKSKKTKEFPPALVNCSATRVIANGSEVPVTASTYEQTARMNSVTETSGTLNYHDASLDALAGEMSEAQGESKQPKKVVNQPVHKSTVRELKCSSCDYVTRKKCNLHLHVARVHGSKPYVCPVCSHRFGVTKDLNHHLKSHTEQFCCEHCGRTLRSKYALATHIARVHNGVAVKPMRRYLCTLCGKMCRNKTDYTVHRNKEHTGIRPFHCNTCDSSFFSQSNLRAHRQIHTDARKYKCQQCGKAFKQRQGLRLHVVIHSVDRPFKCEYCSKTFTQHSALVRHTRTHTSARPFACRFCPAAFNDYSVLRRHMLGIHKLHNVAELRHSVKAACAEARLAQCSNTDTLLPTSSATDTNTTAACDRLVNTDDAATSVSVSSDVLASSPSNADMRIGTSAAQMIVLSPSSAHSDAQTSVADSLPHYVLIDAWWSVERHQTNV